MLFVLCGFFLPCALVSRLLAWAGAARAALRWAAGVQRLWARSFLVVLGIEPVVEGRLPEGACLIVANHLSYVDIPVLAALLPGRFVAKSEVSSWPVLGQLASTVGTIFVQQRKGRDLLRVEREMTRTLAAGVPVLLFPEGRSTRGSAVERFHSSLLQCAADGRFRCLAVALGYETPGAPWAPAATVCWWGGMGFWRHAWGLVGLRRIRVRVSVSSQVRSDSDRKLLTAALHADLVARFEPVRQAPVPPDFPWPELFRDARPEKMVPSRFRE